MDYNFDMALNFVLQWEGFISDNPDDPGGLTIWGISSRSYKDAVKEMKRLIANEEKDKAFKIAKRIYYQNYWLKCGCNDLPYPLNVIVFDTAVNMGRRRAMEILKSSRNWKDYLLQRLYIYSKFKKAKIFFRGWANRVLDLYRLIKDEEKKC